MPLYSDANYYYSGGSSQLYSPYYPGSSSAIPSSSSIYNPYSSTYNRAIGGSYVVPISTSRTPSYTSTHSLAASRYQPKLSTITETSPLISSARHKTLIPLTRIQSPKYTSYSTPTPVHTPKYIPARPILINTADIDVSANRYRKRKEETLRQAHREAGYTSPSSSIKTRSSAERKEEELEEEQKLRNEFAARQAANDTLREPSPEKHINRSTIKRNRAVVRLSTIRSRSKDRYKNKSGDSSSPEPEKRFKDLPIQQPPEEVPLKWREKLAEDLAAIPTYPSKKSPGEVLREKYLIQEFKDKEDYAAQHRAQRMAGGWPKETIEQVIVELDPLHHTVRRLSIPQCPTFHDICEDISSDKIDDDLNAGELRRRASIIQSQEKELLNELQKSASGTFQMITMERRGSHDSVDELPHKRHSKRSSKKGKKIRTKITAIVEVENTLPLATILQEKEEGESDQKKSPKPNFTANLESVEEHHKIHQVLKLPKKKSIKRAVKTKEQEILPEGFMSSLPKPQVSPKKNFVKPIAEVFTFDENFVKQTAEEKSMEDTVEILTMDSNPDTPKEKSLILNSDILKTSKSGETNAKSSQTKTLEKSSTINIELKTPTSPKVTFNKEDVTKTLEKSSSLSFELKSPSSPKDILSKKPTSLVPANKPTTQKPLEKSNLNIELKSISSPKNILDKEQNAPASPKTIKEFPKSEEVKSLTKTPKTSTSTDNVFKPESNKTLEKTKSLEEGPKSPVKQKDTLLSKASKPLDKSSSLNIELKTPASPKPGLPQTIKEETAESNVATPKQIKKTIIKSDSGEDFWEQIGTRETLYMNKRKKEIVECQWKKREELLESTNEDEVKNIKEIKSLVTSQKIEALKKSGEDHKNSKGVVSRSNSNESALKKKSPTKSKEENQLPQTKTDQASKTPLTPKDLKILDAKTKTTDKFEIAKTPVVTKMSKESSLLSTPKSSPSSPVTKTFSTTSTSNTTTTSPKIIGHEAKSPEQQESAEQNKFFPTAPAKSNNNNNEIDINKTTASNEKQLLAKTFTLPTENTKITLATSATGGVPEATTTKQPEIKQVKKAPTTTETKNAAVKPKPTGVDNKTLAAKTGKTDQESSNISKSKASPNAINSDQFVPKAPAKTNTSPVKILTKLSEPATASTSATSSNNATAARTPDKNKTTTTTSTHQTNADDAATTTAIKAAKKADDSQQICNKIKNENTANTNTNTNNKINDNGSANDNDETINNSSTCGGNLSKFATVSNLAQCLHDVDADLAEYLPSSAEISENEDYKTDDSDFDYSSIDGWEKLTPSMKKKVKQRRRKEKQAEQARFDPQKKVKIDTTRKLYVKDEAPRFPLVATPRPLWKREKIVYPDEDSDDESDSEENGSTEETEDSDECTTSEEYEDDINPLPSGVVGNVKSDSGTSAGDGGLSDTNKDNSSIIRMSTCSNDSGFEGGTAPSSPKKMLECDVNCHKKCERLTANLCGVNQKLIVEALANVKRGARETRDSPSSPPSSNPVYKIEAIEGQNETSYTYSQFQKSGRFTPPATIIPRFKNYTVDDFHFLAVLGKGSFGKVLLAELRDTTYYYAVKCLKKDVVLEDDDVDSTLIERKVLALGTKHPYLCHLFCTFQTESHLFFVMEYLNGGDLMFHIQESGRFTEERARFYGAEIVSGLKFLHKKGIIYRDLKLDNVLLDYEGHVRIADFGMCKLQIYLDKTADSFCGTPDYMAPEIIKGDNYNQNVDWWSFGVLLYEMLIGQSPFSGCDEDELFWSICNELPWFPVYISAEATSILKGLLEKDYTKRIGSHYSPAGDIVEHIFFRPIDWNLLEKRQIEPPFRPQVKHPLDTQYFDRVFTRERVRLTPIDKDILQSMDQKQFLGFTYTNPHITLD